MVLHVLSFLCVQWFVRVDALLNYQTVRQLVDAEYVKVCVYLCVFGLGRGPKDCPRGVLMRTAARQRVCDVDDGRCSSSGS
jgi:hypothetical protein